MTEFIKPGDPGVVDATATPPAGDAGDDDAGELEPPAMQTQVPKWVPEL
jgi:hypothetical protein